MVIAASERNFPEPRYFGDARPMSWPDDVEYFLITEDTVLFEGLEVLLTPGHAPGQLSLMLDLPDSGPVLLTGDAISRATEPEEGFAGSWDVEQAQANGKRLLALAAEKEAKLIYGHDPAQWRMANCQ